MTLRELCVDAETFYASDYSLKTLSSVEYIRDPRCKIHGLAVIDNGSAPFWVPGAELRDFCASIDWADTRLISHTYFDSLLLHEHFRVQPAEFVDTAGLARCLIGGDADLGRLMPLLGLGKKGDDLKETKGLHELPKETYDKLVTYALNDVLGCWGIYQMLYPLLPEAEKRLLSLTGRISSIGVLRINHEVISAGLQELETEQQRVIEAAGIPAPVLRSNQKFSAYVQSTLGLGPPTKLNDKGQEIPAFSKNDIEFSRFRAEHPEHDLVWKAKLAAMSNSDITRARRFKAISKLGDGSLPMMQNFFGAHTGRASGGGGLNVQNLVRGSATRLCLEAPPGYQVLVADSSNIELRVNAWFAGQEDVLQVLREGGDVYSHVASAHFGYKVTKKTHPDERQFGKLLCFGAETPVLTDKGWQPLCNVSTLDKVWDGEEFVSHDGLIYQGEKCTINLHGVQVTPEHLVWCGNQWRTAQELAQSEPTLSQALASASANLPSQATSSATKAVSTAYSCDVTAAPQNTELLSTTSALDEPHDAEHAQCANKNPSNHLPQRSHETSTSANLCQGPNANTPSQPSATASVNSLSPDMNEASEEESATSSSNAPAEHPNTASPFTTSSAVHPPAATPAPSSNGNSQKPTHVFDLLNCGPRNRFTILTDKGPLIVHNCLGLGFSMGWKKFQTVCALGFMGAPPVRMTDEEAYQTVMTWRRNNHAIVSMWKTLGELIPTMLEENNHTPLGPGDVVVFEHEAIKLPNDTRLLYTGLKWEHETESWRYMGHHKLTPGLLDENIVQSLARHVVFDQMLEIDALDDVTVVGSTHDEVIAICPESRAPSAMDEMLAIMRRPPSWAPDLPLDAEGGWAQNYSK